MQILLLLFTFIWLLVLNVAVATFVKRYFHYYSLSKFIGIFGLTLIAFTVEHYHGFGSLHYLYPTLFVVALLYLVLNKVRIKDVLQAEWPFWVGFLYAFLWLYKYPDIHPGTEHMTDLFFIANYADGTTLPPVNRWYPPQLFDFYYAFQHYQAALFSRITSLSPSYAYHIGFSLLFGYMASLIWESTVTLTQSKKIALLLMVTILVGGTGVSPFIEWLKTPDAPDSSIIGAMRFAGGSEPNTILAEFFSSPDRSVQHTALETFGYNLYIGDFHPPISGFVIFVVFLYTLFLRHKGQLSTPQALLIYTLCFALVVISNVWLLPLVAIIGCGWMAFAFVSGNTSLRSEYLYMVSAGVLALILILPFLVGLSNNPSGASIKITPIDQYTPLGLLFIQFWPVYVAALVTIMLAWGADKKVNIGLLVGLLFVVLFTVSEVLYVEDGISGGHNRTNSTMKWWAPIFFFGQVTSVWYVFAQQKKATWAKWALIICLVLPTAFNGFFMLRHYFTVHSDATGKLHGHHWISKRDGVKELIEYLQRAPDGLVMENVKENSFTEGSAIALFSGKKSFIGWTVHLVSWKQSDNESFARMDRQRDFYADKLPDPTAWLTGNNIRYVVLIDNQDENKFKSIHSKIEKAYKWTPFSSKDYTAGIWERKE